MENNEEEQELTASEKWVIAVTLGLLFFILSSPAVFRVSNTVLSKLGIHTLDSDNRPTPAGWAIHIVIFVLLVRALMK